MAVVPMMVTPDLFLVGASPVSRSKGINNSAEIFSSEDFPLQQLSAHRDRSRSLPLCEFLKVVLYALHTLRTRFCS